MYEGGRLVCTTSGVPYESGVFIGLKRYEVKSSDEEGGHMCGACGGQDATEPLGPDGSFALNL